MPLQLIEHKPECLLPGENGEMITRKGAVVDKNRFTAMMNEYYGYRGGDVSTGLQTTSILAQLELADVADDLKARGTAVRSFEI